MKKMELLDILAAERIHGILEEVLRENELYISAQNEHDKACEKLEQMDLDIDQKRIVNEVLFTSNHCGAMYGAVAYRQGMDDGIKLLFDIIKVD